MPTCTVGHQSESADFCDTCGLPIDQAVQILESMPQPAATPDSKTLVCPNCQTVNLPQALFCEACGYDFETGQAPDYPSADDAYLDDSLTTPDVNDSPATPEAELIAEAELGIEAADAAWAVDEVNVPETAIPEAETLVTDDKVVVPSADVEPVKWVAELWIDPDWYALQGSPDPLPSVGPPVVVALVSESNLIGRMSVTREIYPQIDCDLDTGVSRSHAMLTTDSTRWWIEDLDSANGTFVGDATGPLPSMPIPRGRVELSAEQRIYLGAWTRIVIRETTDDEKQVLAA